MNLLRQLKAWAQCPPRRVLERVVDKLQAQGYPCYLLRFFWAAMAARMRRFYTKAVLILSE
jgi:hypothetical protein